jgi:hypothetical protein
MELERMTYEPDAWDALDAQNNGIIGQHLKCARGLWLLDGDEIETGDEGVRLCVIMTSATIGWVLWDDGRIADTKTGRPASGFVPPFCPEGWNPYTALTCVRADEGNEGQLCTFTSSSWGGRKAFNGLVSQYCMIGKSRFPICTLETRPKGDKNGNIDPVFKVVGWQAKDGLAAICPADDTAPPATPQLPAPQVQKVTAAELISDDLPF